MTSTPDALDHLHSSAETATRIASAALPAGAGSLIDGEIRIGGGDPVDLVTPTTGERYATYDDAGDSVLEQLLDSSSRAARAWAATDPFRRAAILRDVAAAVAEHAEDLALLETATSGKPIRDTRAEAAKVAEMYAYYAGWADKVLGETIPVPGNWLTYTRREPVGVVTAVTPWNAPLFTAGWNSAAPLAVGNAVIIKPSEFTPHTTLRLAEIAHRAGLPAGVLNVAVGAGPTTGARVTTDRRIGKVAFIGSVGTGRRVAAGAAAAGIPTVLELGGKSANIVFADADLDRAADGAVAAIFAGAGQSCVAGSRLLVQRSVHDTLLDRILDRTSRLRVGDPFDPRTEIGPIVTPGQLATVNRLITEGIAGGAQRLTGEGLPSHLTASALATGHWVAPTVLTDVAPTNTLETTEVFGPVLGAAAFDEEGDAITRANATHFGLAGAVWTTDVSRAHRVAAAVSAGTFWINSYKTIHVAAPFGGFGDSGHGRSSGPSVLAEYTQPKAVWVPLESSGPPFPSLTH
jgi:aldehyde dehydrogenase (NAD+)